MTLSQKETTLLQDLKSQEQVCIEKYAKYSNQACDGQLKNLFSTLGQKEQQHFDTINQILGGTVPSMSGGQSGASSSPTITPSTMYNEQTKQQDCYLCKDALSTEKHVSSAYNTSIFEFKDVSIRDALNHIQKEEQEHGQQIYNFMSQNGMYN